MKVNIIKKVTSIDWTMVIASTVCVGLLGVMAAVVITDAVNPVHTFKGKVTENFLDMSVNAKAADGSTHSITCLLGLGEDIQVGDAITIRYKGTTWCSDTETLVDWTIASK
jgi:nitrogen fixation protein FixH